MLAALIPAPRRHVLRYHGTLAPNAKWRRLVVPAKPLPAARHACADEVASREPPGVATAGGSRMSWAHLMRRVWGADVLACPRCNGRLRIVATVTNPTAVKAILECLGLPGRPPPLAPAREREQAELRFQG